MSLYRAYRAERNSGKSHAQIVADGIFGSLAGEFLLTYDLEIAEQADSKVEYMRRMAERDSIGDQDPYGRATKGQP